MPVNVMYEHRIPAAMGRTFTRSNLLRAGRRWHERNGVDGFYTYLVLADRAMSIEEKVWSIRTFLDEWDAFYYIDRRKGLDVIEERLPSFLKSNSRRLKALGRYQLWALDESHLTLVKRLAEDLGDLLQFKGRDHPTAMGKLLHALMPSTVMLWDSEIIRKGYGLSDTVDDYLAYNRWARQLSMHLSAGFGTSRLRAIEAAHARIAGVHEPLAKIIDELAYSSRLRNRAVSEIGSPTSFRD